MATRNIEMNVKTSSGYDVLYPTSSASQISYSNSSTSTIISGDNVQTAIDQLFTSVSNGKSQIASAITDMGVSTSGGDSFETMANNIKNISGNFYENEVLGVGTDFGCGVYNAYMLSPSNKRMYNEGNNRTGIYIDTFNGTLNADQYYAVSIGLQKEGITTNLFIVKINKNNEMEVIYKNFLTRLGYNPNVANSYNGEQYTQISYDKENYRILFYSPSYISYVDSARFMLEYFVDLKQMTRYDGYYSINYSTNNFSLRKNREMQIDCELGGDIADIIPKVVVLNSASENALVGQSPGSAPGTTSNMSGLNSYIPNIMNFVDKNRALTITGQNFFTLITPYFSVGGDVIGHGLRINQNGSVQLVLRNNGNEDISGLSASLQGRLCDVTYYI